MQLGLHICRPPPSHSLASASTSPSCQKKHLEPCLNTTFTVDSDGFSWVPFLNTLFNQLLGLGNPEYTPLNKLLHIQVMLQLKKMPVQELQPAPALHLLQHSPMPSGSTPSGSCCTSRKLGFKHVLVSKTINQNGRGKRNIKHLKT